MTEVEMRALVDTSVQAFNTADWELWRSVHAPNCSYDDVSNNRRSTGFDEIIRSYQQTRSAFPDLKGTITSFRAAGSEAISEFLWTGTHTGDFPTPMGLIPPSGQTVTIRSVLLMKVENDLLTETRHYVDALNLLRQINALPASLTRATGV